MSKRPLRNHSPAFKAKVALAAVRGEKTLGERAQQFDVHSNQITQWRSQLHADSLAGISQGEADGELIDASLRRVIGGIGIRPIATERTLLVWDHSVGHLAPDRLNN